MITKYKHKRNLDEEYNQDYRDYISRNLDACIKYLQYAKEKVDTYAYADEKEVLDWLIDDLHMTSAEINDLVQGLIQETGIKKYY